MIFLLCIVYDAFIFDNFIITSNQSINQSIPFIFDRTGWWSLTPMTTTWVASESWRSRRTPRTSSPRDMTACSVVIHGSKLSVFWTLMEFLQEYFRPTFFLFCLANVFTCFLIMFWLKGITLEYAWYMSVVWFLLTWWLYREGNFASF